MTIKSLLSGKPVEVEDGLALCEANMGDDIWLSWEDGGSTLVFHSNPKPEEIQPHWFKAAGDGMRK